jgi:osmotically-inducible protein OsmY
MDKDKRSTEGTTGKGKLHLRLLNENHDRYDSDDLSRPSGADYSGQGPVGYRRSDEKIFEEVFEVLMRHREVDATNIAVKVEVGVVYLTGIVPTRRMKKLSELAVEKIYGVQDVCNELVVISGDETPRGPDAPAKKDLGINH